MSVVRMILEKPDQTVLVWEGEAQRAENRVVLRHGRLGKKLRTTVVSAGGFSQDDAEIELQHRVSKKWAAGYVEETPTLDETFKPVSRPERDVAWPAVHFMPTPAFRNVSMPSATAEPLDKERALAAIVTGAFGIDIPAFWGTRPKTLTDEGAHSLPMLIYASALARHGLIHMADEQGNSLDPVAFIDRHKIEEDDPRVNQILPDLELVSMSRALNLAAGDKGEWFF